MEIEEFNNLLKKHLKLEDVYMTDSVFEPIYQLTEVDLFYFLYQLILENKCKKADMKKLLECKRITFQELYELCY